MCETDFETEKRLGPNPCRIIRSPTAKKPVRSLKIERCDCTGLTERDYRFIEQSLSDSKLFEPGTKEEEIRWRKLAPKLYRILLKGKRKYGWPAIPDHLEVNPVFENDFMAEYMEELLDV